MRVNILLQNWLVLEVKFEMKESKSNFGHEFGKDVCNLMCNGDMLSNKKTERNLFTRKVII